MISATYEISDLPLLFYGAICDSLLLLGCAELDLIHGTEESDRVDILDKVRDTALVEQSVITICVTFSRSAFLLRHEHIGMGVVVGRQAGR